MHSYMYRGFRKPPRLQPGAALLISGHFEKIKGIFMPFRRNFFETILSGPFAGVAARDACPDLAPMPPAPPRLSTAESGPPARPAHARMACRLYPIPLMSVIRRAASAALLERVEQYIDAQVMPISNPWWLRGRQPHLWGTGRSSAGRFGCSPAG
jgi:hypothetical protein